MAELLVRVRDKVNVTDFYADCKCTKRGDVIVVCPDGWPWGDQELTRPEYRLVRLQGVGVAAVTPYLAPELDIDPTHPSRTLQRRLYKIDFSNLTIPTAFKTFVADDTRTTPMFVVPAAQVATIQAAIVQKAPIPDPAILGTATPTVIG